MPLKQRSVCEVHQVLVFEAPSSAERLWMTFQRPANAVAFSPDGYYLLTASGFPLTGSSVPNDVSVARELWRSEDLINKASSRRTRNLKEDEWKQFMPGEKYRETCPKLP